MTFLFRPFALVAALAVGAGVPALVQAQTAGTVLLRVGATEIKPHVSSGNLTAPSLPGTQSNVGSDTEPAAGITYMLTDHLAVDVPLAVPFKQDISGSGAIAGVGKLGDVHAAPFTVLGQYRFLEPASMWRPYLGAGLTYAKFYKERSTATLSALTGGTPATPTTLSVRSKLAATVAAGVSVAFGPHWFVDAVVLHTFLKTRTTLSTGQTLDTRLDPNTVALAVGYAF